MTRPLSRSLRRLVAGRAATHVLLVALPWVLGCEFACATHGPLARDSGSPTGAAPSKVRHEPSCEPAQGRDLALGPPTAAGGGCPWRLREFGPGLAATLELRRDPGRGQAAAVFPGVWPESCARDRCAAELYLTSLGPGVLLIAPNPASGMPRQLWWGRGHEGRLRFDPLFVGPRVFSEGTDLGPAYVLAPASCSGDWGWVAQARLGGAIAEAPDPAVLAVLEATGSSPQHCEALAVALP